MLLRDSAAAEGKCIFENISIELKRHFSVVNVDFLCLDVLSPMS